MFENLGQPAGAGIGKMQGLRAACGCLPAIPTTEPWIRESSVTPAWWNRFEIPADLADHDLAEQLEAAIMECVCKVFNESGAVPFSEEGIHTVLTAFKGAFKTLKQQSGGDIQDEN